MRRPYLTPSSVVKDQSRAPAHAPVRAGRPPSAHVNSHAIRQIIGQHELTLATFFRRKCTRRESRTRSLKLRRTSGTPPKALPMSCVWPPRSRPKSSPFGLRCRVVNVIGAQVNVGIPHNAIPACRNPCLREKDRVSQCAEDSAVLNHERLDIITAKCPILERHIQECRLLNGHSVNSMKHISPAAAVC